MDKDFLHLIDRVDELITREEKLSDETLICECFCVNVGDIREACSSHQVVDLDTLKDNFNLGQGCQGCLKRFENWAHKIF